KRSPQHLLGRTLHAHGVAEGEANANERLLALARAKRSPQHLLGRTLHALGRSNTLRRPGAASASLGMAFATAHPRAGSSESPPGITSSKGGVPSMRRRSSELAPTCMVTARRTSSLPSSK